jgi:hypothetical protein
MAPRATPERILRKQFLANEETMRLITNTHTDVYLWLHPRTTNATVIIRENYKGWFLLIHHDEGKDYIWRGEDSEQDVMESSLR